MFRLARTAALRPTAPRLLPLQAAVRHYAGEQAEPVSPPHSTEKSHDLDVTAHETKEGKRERAAAGAPSAEARGEKQREKKDHPKAPEPVIGMQDERGGKGI